MESASRRSFLSVKEEIQGRSGASSKDAESIVGCAATIFVPTKVDPANAMTNENPVSLRADTDFHVTLQYFFNEQRQRWVERLTADAKSGAVREQKPVAQPARGAHQA